MARLCIGSWGYFRCIGLLALVAGPALAAAEPTAVQGPVAVAVSTDERMLYVASGDARQVVYVALPAGQVARRLDFPAPPLGLALSPDGRTLAVSCAAPQSFVVLLDSQSGQARATIPAGHTAVAPLWSRDGRRLYVANRFDNDIAVIDPAARRCFGRVAAVREPIALASTPDGRTVLAANHLPLCRTDGEFKGDVAPLLTCIDTATLQTSSIALPHGANSLRGVAVTPDGKYALVTHLFSNFEMVPFRVDGGWINTNVVSVVDLPRRKVQATVGLDSYEGGAGNPWDIRLSADGARTCVSVAGTHEIAVVATAELLDQWSKNMSPMMAVWPIYPSLGDSAWKRLVLPGHGPRGLALVGDHAYVAQYFSDSVAVVDIGADATARESEEPRRAGIYSLSDDRPRAGRLLKTIALGPAPKLSLERRGELLFHDATICHQQWLSCASCHPDARADGLNWDLLNDGEGNPKNTKSMLLSHRTPPAMVSGVRMSAEEAVRSGLEHILFAIRPEEEAQAIDAYLKSLTPVPSPRLVEGKLSAAAQRGQKLFHSERVACDKCHPAPLYTDLHSHDVGTGTHVDRRPRYDTPTLIEVWRTAPYLHDGRYTTVEELLREGHHGLRDRTPTLSEQELRDLAEFVLSL